MMPWKNPIAKKYIQYMGMNPISAFNNESDYLYKISDIRIDDSDFKVVDIDKIAKTLDLKNENYIYNKLFGSQGQLRQYSDYKIKIELDSDVKNLYQYRVIIAHEIGHWIINSKIAEEFTEDEKKLRNKYIFEEELLCHHFASSILLPQNVFNKVLNSNELSNSLILQMSRLFQVPDYMILNRIVELNNNFIALYWKKKISDTTRKTDLSLRSIFPNNLIRAVPFIPINATAKDARFKPNLIQKSFLDGISRNGQCNISDFGELKGTFNLFVFNPPKVETLFQQYQRKFDLISLIEIETNI